MKREEVENLVIYLINKQGGLDPMFERPMVQRLLDQLPRLTKTEFYRVGEILRSMKSALPRSWFEDVAKLDRQT